MTKKEIKKELDRLQAIALYTLARVCAKRIDELTEAMGEIMKLEGKDGYDRGGWILSDNMWEDDLSSFIEMFEKNYKSK